MAVMKYIQKNHPNSKFKEKYKDPGCYTTLLNYFFDWEKAGNKIGGWGVNPLMADTEMKLVTEFYHQMKGVYLRHWIISFSPDEAKFLEKTFEHSIQQVLLYAAYCLTAYYKDRYQLVFAVHWNGETHPHIHVMMNTTSYIDGKKFHGDRDEYHAYEAYVKEVLGRKFGLSIFITKDHTSTKYF